ncbi:mothers against decapentaplegic homolog 6-like isoform X2 [Anolis carolinensis]
MLLRDVEMERPLPPLGKVSPWDPQLKGPPNLLEDNHGRPRQETTVSRRSLGDGSWCKLAYWEHRLRVGRLFPVWEDQVGVYSDPTPGLDGLCLPRLPSRSRSRAVRRTRANLGRGLLLSREPGGVWAHNHGQRPFFLHSPTLGPEVHKVPAGHAIKAFEYGGSHGGVSGVAPEGPGPCDPHALRISFSKGWGPRYSRRFITSCPCWVEVLLNGPR